MTVGIYVLGCCIVEKEKSCSEVVELNVFKSFFSLFIFCTEIFVSRKQLLMIKIARTSLYFFRSKRKRIVSNFISANNRKVFLHGTTHEKSNSKIIFKNNTWAIKIWQQNSKEISEFSLLTKKLRKSYIVLRFHQLFEPSFFFSP